MRLSPPRHIRATLSLGPGIVLILATALAQAPVAAGQEGEKKSGWISLFNGKDLDGWTPKITGYAAGENYADTFRVEDGVLKVSYSKYPKFDGKFGHLFSKRKFSHYRLRVEYRFTGDQCPGGPGWAFRNSGVMIHSQPVETMRKDQEFPVSIEVQFLGGDGKKDRATANACTPGTHVVVDGTLVRTHTINSRANTYPGDQWVIVEVEVHGGEVIKHVVEGKTVLEYEKPQYDQDDADAKKLIQGGNVMLGEGYLALQAESHPIEFRKVEILPLEK
jgi:hypothetical protein